MSTDLFICGSGHTRFGALEDTLEGLIVAAAKEAISESGIDPAMIDAVFLGHFNAGLVDDGFAASLIHQAAPQALQYKPALRCENACASGSAALYAGLQALRSGENRCILVVGAEKMTHTDTPTVTRALARAGYQNNGQEAGLSFVAAFARVAEAYRERYQDPLPAMAKIAAKNHANAMYNPLAQLHKPLDAAFCATVSDKNPVIAAPLRLSDCSLISDGAAALVVTSDPAIAANAKRVRFRATQHNSDLLPMASRDVLAFSGVAKAIRGALGQAGLRWQDLDLAEVHDCFTIAELLIYEAIGITPHGEGHRAIEEGIVTPGGALPINISGGLKAKGHPVGATGVSMHALLYRQLTAQAGDMQLDAPQFAMAFNMGGMAVANYCSILEACS